MGRRAEGWSIVWKGDIAHVRFTLNGRRFSVSTGERDSGRASQAAARIYADHVNGSVRHEGVRGPAGAGRGLHAQDRGLDIAVARWLASIEGILDDETVKTYKGYAQRWLGRWGSIDELHDSAIAAFVTDRLRSVRADSVRKELSALRGLLAHAGSKVVVPSIPKKVKGRRAQKRSPSHVADKGKLLAAIEAAPEWSRPRNGVSFPIRARFILQYETGLRAAALNEMRWEDWKGDRLEVREELDKARMGREIPLSARAQAAITSLRQSLSSSKKPSGPIFGRHDYRTALRALADRAGIETAHLRTFRHNRGTHLVDEGVPLTAVAYLFGHKHVSTTAIYAHGTKDVAFKAIQKGKAGDAPA